MIITPTFRRALDFAAALHCTQLRKGTQIPYLSHLFSVCALVLEQGGSEEEAIAALLHDAVEDQGGEPTLRAIRKEFGEAVATIVEGCTDAFGQPKPLWRSRKEGYLQHLETASPAVLLVSCADKLHNARTLLLDYRQHGEALWRRFRASRDETLWYYGELVSLFSRRGPAALAAELARTVDELRTLASGAAG
jgi:(p)ppGpp synthase/HD superfamily hydrolase